MVASIPIMLHTGMVGARDDYVKTARQNCLMVTGIASFSRLPPGLNLPPRQGHAGLTTRGLKRDKGVKIAVSGQSRPA
jgi:hypothetical protein